MDKLLSYIYELPELPFKQEDWERICLDVDALENKNIHSIRNLFRSDEYLSITPKNLFKLRNYFEKWLIIRKISHRHFQALAEFWREYYHEEISSESLIALSSEFLEFNPSKFERLKYKLDQLSYTSHGITGYEMTTLYSSVYKKYLKNTHLSSEEIESDNKVHHMIVIIKTQFRLNFLANSAPSYYKELIEKIKAIIKEIDPISYSFYFQRGSNKTDPREIINRIIVESGFYNNPVNCLDRIQPYIHKIHFLDALLETINNKNLSTLNKSLSICLQLKEFKSSYTHLFPENLAMKIFSIFSKPQHYTGPNEENYFLHLENISSWTANQVKPQLDYECEYFNPTASTNILIPNIHPNHS